MHLAEDALRELVAFFRSSTGELQRLGLTNSTLFRLTKRRVEIQKEKVVSDHVKGRVSHAPCSLVQVELEISRLEGEWLVAANDINNRLNASGEFRRDEFRKNTVDALEMAVDVLPSMDEACVDATNKSSFYPENADTEYSLVEYISASKFRRQFPALDYDIIACCVRETYRSNGAQEFVITMDQWRITERIQKLRLTQLN